MKLLKKIFYLVFGICFLVSAIFIIFLKRYDYLSLSLFLVGGIGLVVTFWVYQPVDKVEEDNLEVKE